MKRPTWKADEYRRFKMSLNLLTLYVELLKEGGCSYSVCGHYLQRWSRKPIPTVEEAQQKAIKAAQQLLRDELKALEEIG